MRELFFTDPRRIYYTALDAALSLYESRPPSAQYARRVARGALAPDDGGASSAAQEQKETPTMKYSEWVRLNPPPENRTETTPGTRFLLLVCGAILVMGLLFYAIYQ